MLPSQTQLPSASNIRIPQYTHHTSTSHITLNTSHTTHYTTTHTTMDCIGCSVCGGTMFEDISGEDSQRKGCQRYERLGWTFAEERLLSTAVVKMNDTEFDDWNTYGSMKDNAVEFAFLFWKRSILGLEMENSWRKSWIWLKPVQCYTIYYWKTTIFPKNKLIGKCVILMIVQLMLKLVGETLFFTT